MENKGKVRAYVMTSGGLDSTLAVKMLQEQGVEVTGIYVSTGFCINSYQKKSGRFDESKADVFKVTEELGIDLEVIDISREYIPIITNPRYGWGKNVNPCIDCRIFMLQKARELMEKNGYNFIATGEVLGQRPMSQRRHTSKLIEEKSGLKGRLLRPLSGKLHAPTEAEQKGWVRRDMLGNISGRSRKEQMRLAVKYGLKTVSAPAGGCCFLTDETYAVRFKDMLQDRKALKIDEQSDPIDMNSLMIMATGRHVKVRRGLRLAIGRNEAENRLLLHYATGQVLLEPADDVPGPTALLEFLKSDYRQEFHQELENVWGKGFLNQWSEDAKKTVSDFLDRSPEISKYVSSDELLLAIAITGRYVKKEYNASIRISLKNNYENKTDLSVVRPELFPEEKVLNQRLLFKANESNFIPLSP